jgi:hypothetical protein
MGSEPEKNEPEELRHIEREAQKTSAEIAADMMKRPGWRWILRPIYRMMKWVEYQCARRLKEDGWR